jgi:hypothetical protein
MLILMKLLNYIYNIIYKKFHLVIFFLLFSVITHFFYNIYGLNIRKYEERMVRRYNYCGGLSYGYIDNIKNVYLKDAKKIYLINFEIYPASYSLFADIDIDENKKKIILLNYKDSKDNKKILKNLQINLQEYRLINKESECFFYKKND